MVRVRPAALADLDFLVSGNLEMALETENLRLDPDTVRTATRALLAGEQAGQYWIAEVDGVPSGQMLITYEWSDWRNKLIWWIQSVYTIPAARRHGVYRALYAHVRDAARAAGACGLRLYVDTTNTRAQQVYAALGMNGDHYRVFEDMFS